MSKGDEAERYWAKLVGQANVILAGASDAELRVQLFDVLQEFFDGSNCWREAISFTVIPESLEYQLMPLAGRVLRLLAVIDQNSVTQAAVMPTIGTVQILFPVSVPQQMTAVVIKSVTDPFQCFPPHIPDWVLPAHGLGILHGLIGTMMMQPGQSYSNQQMGAFYWGKFRGAIAHARVATMKANAVGAQAWAFPQQFSVRGQRGGVSTFNVHPTAVLR